MLSVCVVRKGVGGGMAVAVVAFEEICACVTFSVHCLNVAATTGYT